jgi:hypothetical protein
MRSLYPHKTKPSWWERITNRPDLIYKFLIFLSILVYILSLAILNQAERGVGGI